MRAPCVWRSPPVRVLPPPSFCATPSRPCAPSPSALHFCIPLAGLSSASLSTPPPLPLLPPCFTDKTKLILHDILPPVDSTTRISPEANIFSAFVVELVRHAKSNAFGMIDLPHEDYKCPRWDDLEALRELADFHNLAALFKENESTLLLGSPDKEYVDNNYPTVEALLTRGVELSAMCLEASYFTATSTVWYCNGEQRSVVGDIPCPLKDYYDMPWACLLKRPPLAPGRGYKRVYIDEAHVASIAMAIMAHRMLASDGSLCIAADKGQAIYVFADGIKKAFLTLTRRPATTHYLTINWRNSKAVMLVAQNIRNQFDPDFQMVLPPNAIEGHVYDGANAIWRVLADQIPPGKSIGILSRTQTPLKIAGDCLRELGIPFINLGSAKDLITPIETLISTCHTTTLAGLLLHARRESTVCVGGSGLSCAERRDGAQLAIMYIQELASQSGVSTYDPSGADRLRSYVVAKSMEKGDGRVTLSTIHRAQGLQWHWTMLLEYDRIQLPHVLALENEEMVEAEKRTEYVGVTRAMEVLVKCPVAYYASEEGVDADALREQFIPPPGPSPTSGYVHSRKPLPAEASASVPAEDPASVPAEASASVPTEGVPLPVPIDNVMFNMDDWDMVEQVMDDVKTLGLPGWPFANGRPSTPRETIAKAAAVLLQAEHPDRGGTGANVSLIQAARDRLFAQISS